MTKFFDWVARNRKWIYLGFSIAALCGLTIFLCFPQKQSFTFDELDWSMAYVDGTTFGELFAALSKGVYNMPLWYLLMWPWFNILPTSMIWLLLPNIIFTVVGIIFLGLIGRQLRGDGFGFLCLIFGCTSYVLCAQGAWMFRPYALTFCLAAVVLYLFIRKWRNQSIKNNILFSVFLTLSCLTHWFSIICAAFYGICEFVFVVARKQSYKSLFAYIAPVAITLAWFIVVMVKKVAPTGSYWIGAPKFWDLYIPVWYLLGSSLVHVLMFLVGFIYCIYEFVYGLVKKRGFKSINEYTVIVAIVVATVLSVFFYSIINAKASLFHVRYFLVICPHVFLVSAYGVVRACAGLRDAAGGELARRFNRWICVAAAVSFAAISVVGFANIKKHAEVYAVDKEIGYAAVSNFLLANVDIESDEVLIISNYSFYAPHYYFSKLNKKWPKNVVTIAQESWLNNPFTHFIKAGRLENMLYRMEKDGKGYKLIPYQAAETASLKEIYCFMYNESDYEAGFFGGFSKQETGIYNLTRFARD